MSMPTVGLKNYGYWGRGMMIELFTNIRSWWVSLYDTWVWLLSGSVDPFGDDDNDNILY
jgi:hypothetical protein